MKLHEEAWVFAAGDHKEWHWAGRKIVDRHVGMFRELSRSLKTDARLKGLQLDQSLKYVLTQRTPERDELVTHPTFVSWLHYGLHREEGWGTANLGWLTHLNFIHGFAASLALRLKNPLHFKAFLDAKGHFHFHGTCAFLDFGTTQAGALVDFKIDKAQVFARGRSGESVVNIDNLLTPAERPVKLGGGCKVKWLVPIGKGMAVNDCDPLIRQPFERAGKNGAKDWALADMDAGDLKAFVSVMNQAVRLIQDMCPDIFDELASSIRVVAPLQAPHKNFSASSTYSHVPGLIGLSPYGAPLLQAEVLVHEFCHNKLYLLMEFDSLLDPATSMKAVYLSPWRKDPRHLQGILLGAHAFLNVARFLGRVVSQLGASDDHDGKIRLKFVKLLFQVESALRTVLGHGEFTDFGRRFTLMMLRELLRLYESVPSGIPKIVGQAQEAARKHETDYGVPWMGFHKEARKQHESGRN